MSTPRGAVSRLAPPLALLLAGWVCGACSRAPSGASGAPPATSAVAAASTSTAAGAPSEMIAIDALSETGDCTFGHHGVLLDLGDVTTRARLAPAERSGRIDVVERDGASWARVFARSVSIPFLATDADVASGTEGGAQPVIEARVRGGSAKSIAVYLNGKAAGFWPLAKGEARVVSVPLAVRATDPTAAVTTAGASSPQLVAGTNELLLRFRGAARAGASAPDEEAEIDWIHVGGAVAGEAYAAPTRADAVTSVTLGAVPMRSVSLRAPGYARCIGWLPQTGHLVTSVGVLGAGDADVELRVTRDRSPPAVLASVHVTGDAPWKPLDFPIGARAGKAPPGSAGTLGAIELVATRSTKGARVVFGEPHVVVPPESAPALTAAAAQAGEDKPITGVVLVVLGSETPRALDLYAATAAGSAAQATPVPELDALAKAGLAFDANRASSGSASAAFASILTGLPPRASGVIDDESGLAPDVTTLADVARQAGIRAAMFTANPSTGSAFGFARGWDTYVEHAPDLSEAPGAGTAPFDDAARWIADHGAGDARARFLVVVHARGGHPPWDATPEAMRTLAPPDYTGGIDPRRAAELLVRARSPLAGAGGPRIAPLHLTDSDRTRAWALYGLAIRAHDAALGRLMAALKAAGRDDSTLVIVSGDVGLGEARAPLESSDALDESALATPLVVRFPPTSAAGYGAHVAAPTTSVDVARTIVDAFGLSAPAAFQGQDLARIATGADRDKADARGRPMLAVLGTRFALRWGTFILRGTAPSDETPLDVSKLCDVSLEPACTSDVRGAFPLALSALRREAALQAGQAKGATPVVETPAVRVSLRLWGL